MPQDIAQLVQTAAGPPGSAQTRAAARLMSLLEDQPARLADLLAHDRRGVSGNVNGGARMVVGITGAPGSGKSTLTDTLIADFRHRHPQDRIGVVAVDPTSPFTGGAVLGDRVRMMRHATDPMVFIRSMATRGHLGGLTLGVRGAIRVLELIGCQVVILETVGVGQSEVEVAKVADLTVVVLAPGQGDSIQMLKAGLMEIADLFAVNKADRPGAAELHAALLSMLQIAQAEHSCGAFHHIEITHPAQEETAWPKPGALPEVYLVSAVENSGVPELLTALEQRAAAHGPQWRDRRGRAIREEVRQAVLEEIHHRVEQSLASNGAAKSIEQVLDGAWTVDQLAQELIRKLAQEKK